MDSNSRTLVLLLAELFSLMLLDIGDSLSESEIAPSSHVVGLVIHGDSSGLSKYEIECRLSFFAWSFGFFAVTDFSSLIHLSRVLVTSENTRFFVLLNH